MFEEVVLHLKDPKPDGKGGYWSFCPCPSHRDGEKRGKRSLYTSPGKDGRALIKCFANCQYRDIVKAMGLAEDNLNSAKDITTYDYKDASGNLLFQVCRGTDKKFWQRRPGNNGSWVNGLKGIKPVLYLLPELIKAIKNNEVIFIPEGEKDCNNLVSLGLTATTNPMGAGKWRDYYSDFLKNANVVILPDNDQPGKDHARKVAENLQGKAASIKILELPGLPAKGDISDWLSNGGTKDELLRLADETSEWKQAVRQEPEAKEETELMEAEQAEQIELIKQAIENAKKEETDLSKAKVIKDEIIPLLAKLNAINQAIIIKSLIKEFKDIGLTKKAVEKVLKLESSEDEENETQLDTLLRLSEDIFLFENEFKEPFTVFDVDDHSEIWLVGSKAFKYWLTNQFFNETGSGPNSESLNAAINTLSAKAWCGKEERKLGVRTTPFENAFWYDMTNNFWQAIRVEPQGWEVINKPPILFRRYGHQQAQPMPTRGGNIFKLLDFVNLKDKNMSILYLVSVITSFIPDIPHVVFVIFGPEGSGKSTISKITRMIIDPSGNLTCKCYSDRREFVQYLAHNYVAILENLSGISPILSDTICSAVTGDGDSKRQLFTDDEDVIYNFKRVFIINGINNVVTRPDLLRRSILLQIEKQPDGKILPETTLWRLFEAARPDILGGIFDTLNRAMEIYPDMKLTGLYDMADYTLWGSAIAEALGYGADAFLTAYTENRGEQVKEAIANHPVASAITVFMQEREEWGGRPSELLVELEKIAETEKINIKSKAWPKAANALTRRLSEVKTILSKTGIEITDNREATKRCVLLTRKCAENIVITVIPSLIQAQQGFLNDDIMTIHDDNKNTVIKPSSPEPLENKTSDDINDNDDIFPASEVDDNFSSPESEVFDL